MKKTTLVLLLVVLILLSTAEARRRRRNRSNRSKQSTPLPKGIAGSGVYAFSWLGGHCVQTQCDDDKVALWDQ